LLMVAKRRGGFAQKTCPVDRIALLANQGLRFTLFSHVFETSLLEGGGGKW